jgi:TPP-dependent pyruvate/acetoin dehydrogenase alpha subunit
MAGLLDEIMGRPSGICKGKGGSQHLHIKNFFSNGILGGMVPVATGIALAQKLNGQKGISVVFAGDGAMAEGVIYESLNMAALWNLPLLLVVENNHIAQSTPSILEHGSPIEGLPAAFGVKTEQANGNNVVEVRRATDRIIAEMRLDSSPRCLVLDTYRLGPHSKGDDTRSSDEIAQCRTHDPLKIAEAGLSASVIAKIGERCNLEMKTLLAEFPLG